MHHWRAQDKPLARQLSALLDDPELEVLTELTPSIEEDGQCYIRKLPPQFYIRKLPLCTAHDDQMPESRMDRDRICHCAGFVVYRFDLVIKCFTCNIYFFKRIVQYYLH
ncbi:uncharacterized protein LOC111372715 [Olea europaea var. sylvestris]|uniref:uncharacterized protein LOC111372715 n=1 Tax=Olea europaea var. sylvestris TaxID=158386 RepID=UPI000C1D6600|nr:uncharacterized protein LOC111372715 [Olea europaea var. sylvestris]